MENCTRFELIRIILPPLNPTPLTVNNIRKITSPPSEDVALIESLEESKRVATDISDKVAEARETEGAINDSRNK